MEKYFLNLFLGFVVFILGPLWPEASYAQNQSVAASVDLDGNSRSWDGLNDGRAPDPYPSIPPISEPSFDAAIEPVVSSTKPSGTVDWKGLTKDSLVFLTVMQGFRLATEPGTRAALSNPFFKGYVRAVQNMHGFSDGDQFYVNYIGHPMQGAVSGFIWANNDRAYKDVYFGRDKRYWKERLRGGAFSYVYSVQFEIGPVSEASLGDMQKYYPAQGFVDHVVTPAIGMGWAIGEDVIDRYLIRGIEQKTGNPSVRMLARAFLNPARSFANLMSLKYPWYRMNRPAPHATYSADYYKPVPVQEKISPPIGVAPFEFNTVAVLRTYLGGNSGASCVGGGAGIAFRVAKEWQIAGDVNGCKMTNLPENTSGDSLTYVIGPRWSSQISPRWTTHAQFLIGGTKVTQEMVDPEKKRFAEQRSKDLMKMGIDPWPPPYAEFAKAWDSNAFAIVGGAGVDLKFTSSLLLRTKLDYSHSWNRDLNNINYRSSVQFSSGLVLNMGTW